MFELTKVLRPHILNVTPYSSARDEYEGDEGIFLDANENPLGSITQRAFNRYPDPYQKELKRKIAALRQVRPEQIFLGNGSDEAIDLLMRATCTPGQDRIIILPPTYGMYEVSAAINDVALIRVPLTAEYQIDRPAVLRAITPQTKLIFLCSPNNPTGNALNREDMVAIIRQAPGIVVVDEAYIDFLPEHTLVTQLAEFPNLVVLQTFSKAWGLAGLRLGMAFASPEIIAVLNRLKAPYNVNTLTQELASQGLDNGAAKDRMVKEILNQRDVLVSQLATIPVVEKVFPSQANFLLVKVKDAPAVYRHLVADKIIVRDRSKVQLCENSLRITVGTAEENGHLLDSLKNFAG
jgi:histidinol-phosphate aminotransferase